MTDRTAEFHGCIRVVNPSGSNRAAVQSVGGGEESYDNVSRAPLP